MKTPRRALAALAAALVVASCQAAPAAAAECHPDGSRYFCGVLKVSAKSECASLSFSGWTKSIGGVGTGPSIVRPGQSSTLYHRDSDGADPDDRCTWYTASTKGDPLRAHPFGSGSRKNRAGTTWHIAGVRK